MRKVLIEKVSNTTRVTTWDIKKPDKKVIKSYNLGANTLIENDVLIIEDLDDIFPKQRISFLELDENYGTTDIESFGVYLNENGFFLINNDSENDVLEFANLAAFPATGESGKIYVALDTNFTYRWSGSAYVKISDSTKLDKSTTASSVYGTNTAGGQTMIPLSELGGGDFKKKIENTHYKSTLSGENVIISFQAAGQSHYMVTSSGLVSVAGFTTAGLTTPMYEGQDVIFENQTGHDITLKDSFGVDTSFVIGDDLIVPNEGKIWFRFRNNELELIDKNWFGIQEVVTPENLGEFINGLDSKTDIKDDDEFIISDSEDSLKSKKTRFLDLKTKLKSYFDTFYLSLSIFNDFVTDVFDSLDSKQDKVTTGSVRRVYGVNTSNNQEMIPFSDFGTVKGTGTINRISKFTASGTIGDSQIFDNGTNVGVGTTSPQAKLDVRAQGVLETDIAFRVRNSTNTQNFLVVNGAGDVSNSGAGGGETNTQFGINAGRSRTGAYNSLFGNQAGVYLTTGNSNTLFGFNAGLRITTHSGNTLIGSRAGESTMVDNIVAVGGSALLSNQTGTSNVAVGNEALYSNTASGNTAVGDGAGSLNTTGQRNIFLGYASGKSNTTGQYNTYIGSDSGTYQTTGNDNLFIGIGSGRYEANGITNLITTTNSLFIGNNTRGNASGQTNQIVIGHNAIGLGSNTVVLGNASITTTQLRGQVIMGSFASAPTGIEGAIYYNSADKKHYGFNGTTWNALY